MSNVIIFPPQGRKDLEAVLQGGSLVQGERSSGHLGRKDTVMGTSLVLLAGHASGSGRILFLLPTVPAVW